jgi:5-methylcytosine-specific restriction endonuclease McrA
MLPRPCLSPRCPSYALPGESRCLEHRRQFEKQRKAEGATGRRGTSAEWSKARLAALARAHWKCSRCGKHISEVKRLGGKLHVHHRDGNAKRHAPENLEPLCSLPGGGCHEKAHRKK